MDVRAGDVLFFRTDSAVAAAARLLDGAEADRVALALDARRAAEVRGERVEIRDLSEPPALVRRLKDTTDLAPVVARAEALAASEPPACGAPALMLALHLSARKACATASLRAMQRAAFDAAVAAIQHPVPLTAAQFVFRAFDDALPEHNDVYTVRLNTLHLLEVVSGVPADPGAGVARRRGRGVHPDSALAWAAQPMMRQRLGAASGAPAGGDLEGLCAKWLGEVRDGSPRQPLSRADGDALLASLQRFAAAWSGENPGLARGALPPQLELLFRCAADVATPGDLLRSEDLFTV